MGFLKKLFGRKDQTHYLEPEEMEAISGHFERHVGATDNVFHEIISDAVHIDLYTIPEVPGRDFKVIYTTGMSALPMPGKPAGEQYAELFMILPKDWPLGQEDFQDDANFWPLRMLKTMARVPTDYKAGIGPGISMPNGDPAALFPGSRFCCVMIGRSDMFPLEFAIARIGGKEVNFYPVVALTQAEMDWKVGQEEGTALLDRYRSEGRDPLEVARLDRNRADFI